MLKSPFHLLQYLRNGQQFIKAIILHIPRWSECVDTVEGKTVYVGGTTSGRFISNEMKYEELRRLVAEDLWHEEDERFKMKFKVSFAEDILIDYNNSNGHVYICRMVVK